MDFMSIVSRGLYTDADTQPTDEQWMCENASYGLLDVFGSMSRIPFGGVIGCAFKRIIGG